MKLLAAILVWVVMGIIIGAGILLAIKSTPWLLILSLAAFVVAVGKIGCAVH